MAEPAMTPTHYALLIGINYYKSKPLEGAVADVRSMRVLLESAFPAISTKMFTASKHGFETGWSPPDDLRAWPTKQNITVAFDDITRLAAPGDFVYVHYSGHGTRQRPDTKSYHQSSGDLALVLLTTDREHPETYLFGRSLAFLFNAMVRKGLILTVVLDCCFSASFHRNDHASVRFLPYEPSIALNIGETPGSEAKHSAYRTADMSSNWVIDQDRYAVLVACGPDEKALEARFQDREMHGALSYVLLKSLDEGKRLCHPISEIYESLRAGFRQRALSKYQNPIRFGNSGQAFFGAHIPSANLSIHDYPKIE